MKEDLTLVDILGANGNHLGAEYDDPVEIQIDEAPSWTPEEFKSFLKGLEPINFSCSWVLEEKKVGIRTRLKSGTKRLYCYMRKILTKDKN